MQKKRTRHAGQKDTHSILKLGSHSWLEVSAEKLCTVDMEMHMPDFQS